MRGRFYLYFEEVLEGVLVVGQLGRGGVAVEGERVFVSHTLVEVGIGKGGKVGVGAPCVHEHLIKY